ncbi:MAG: hypothetical protein K0B37_03085 [Bacteroidales bacterium]|nr:hypothetical protein [Bacteroidales bacterium]
MQKLRIFWPIIAIILGVFSSCSKDELALPSKVYFHFGMTPHSDTENEEGFKNGYGSAGQPGPVSFTIDKGTLVVAAIEFDGKREQGQDVYFISDFPTPVVAKLHEEGTQATVDFDIPQGIYKRIDISLHLGNDHNDIPLKLEGLFNRPGLGPVTIRFEYPFDDILTIRSTGGGANQEITLRKDQPSTAMIRLDAGSLFRLINPAVFMNADIIVENGQNILEISNSNNRNIFNQIAARMNNAFTIVFE